MKKIIFLIATLLFGFSNNKVYECNVEGLKLEKNNQTYVIIKTKQNEADIKKMLKNLYKIKMQYSKKSIKVKTGKIVDNFRYVSKYNNILDMYVNSDKSLVLFADKNQIAINIPANKLTISYKCH